MATGRDCEELSPNARKIFDKIKLYFPLDDKGKSQYTEAGLIFTGSWSDLCKSTARNERIQWEKQMIGHVVEKHAIEYRRTHGSLAGFTTQHYSRVTQHHVELLLLYEDLNFQIETGDLTD
jgi:hypothetical protein